MLKAGIVGGIIAAGQIVAAAIGQRFVTPNSDPRDNEGRKLTPE